jgi:hypothetical protein
VILYFGNSAVCEALERFGFWSRPSGRKVMVHVGAKGDPSRAALLAAENWHLTGADIDTDE